VKWEDAGWLTYCPAGRDLLLELLPPPADAGERIETLLEKYETVQLQRVDELSAYARTLRCRHGHLNAYLGGRTIEHCGACDNCVEIPPLPDPGLPDEREQFLTILRCAGAARWSWGRTSLVRILRGQDEARFGRRPLSPRARAQTGFGALTFRSGRAVERMVERLEDVEFLQAHRLDHGGVVLDLTPAGKAALKDSSKLDGLVSLAQGPSPRQRPDEEEPELDVDEELFEALRVWRLEQARAQGVAPFIVFHNRHLRAIAAHRPVTLEALSELKGVGPRRLERYGDAVIELVREHVEGGGSDAQAGD